MRRGNEPFEAKSAVQNWGQNRADEEIFSGAKRLPSGGKSNPTMAPSCENATWLGKLGLWVLLPSHRQNSFVSIGEGGAILFYPIVLYVVSIVLLVFLLGRGGGEGAILLTTYTLLCSDN